MSWKRTASMDEGGRIALRFFHPTPSAFLGMVRRIKGIAGATWHPARRIWTVPAIPMAIADLAILGFDGADPATCQLLRQASIPFQGEGELAKAAQTPETAPWASESLDDASIPDGLRSYQLDSLKFLRWRKGIGMIGDDMGTGKTVQALAWLAMNPHLRPALLVVTSTTKLQWQRQWQRWIGRGDSVEILRGQSVHELDPASSYIVNWDILAHWAGTIWEDKAGHKRFSFDGPLSRIGLKCMVADEVQAAGNPTSNRTKAYKAIGKKVSSLVPLSGTPIKTRPRQFFTTLNLLDPENFPNQQKYLNRYCGPKMGWGGTMTYDGSSNEAELHQLISRLMIRRMKSEVVKELPEKTRSVVPIDCALDPEYERMADRLLSLQGVSMAETRRQMEELGRTAFTMKRQGCIDWIAEFVESGEQLVVFYWHHAVGDFLAANLGQRAVRIDGSTGNRDGVIAKFTTRKAQVLLAQIIAVGVGVDGLQEVCSNAAVVEFSGSPGDMEQAEDRLHRIGQGKPVTIHYLIAPGTIDDDYASTLATRSTSISSIIDGDKGVGLVLDGYRARKA